VGVPTISQWTLSGFVIARREVRGAALLRFVRNDGKPRMSLPACFGHIAVEKSRCITASG